MIRPAEARDAAAIARIYAPNVSGTVISFETIAPTAEEMAGRIDKTLRTHPWLVAGRDGEVLGYAYAGEHRQRAAYRWSVDVTAYVDASARRQGVGRALYLRLLAILKAQGFRSAFAGIALPNLASVGLHEAVGFEPVGVYRDVGFKLGAWRDVGWWGARLSDSPGAPSEPVPFSEFRRTAAFRKLHG